MGACTVVAEFSCKGSGSGAAFDHPEAGRREEGRGKRISPVATIAGATPKRRISGSTLPSSPFPLPTSRQRLIYEPLLLRLVRRRIAFGRTRPLRPRDIPDLQTLGC